MNPYWVIPKGQRLAHCVADFFHQRGYLLRCGLITNNCTPYEGPERRKPTKCPQCLNTMKTKLKKSKLTRKPKHKVGRVSPCAPPKGKTTNVALIEDNGPIVPDKYYPSGRGLPLFEKLDFTKRTKLVRIKRRRQRSVARKTLTRLTKNKQTRK